MIDLEPGVQLTDDTIAAMQRLSTSPSKPAMTKQHKATPEQWDDAGAFAADTRACLLELRARIEALEELHNAVVDLNERFNLDPLVERVEALERTQQQTHQDKLDRLIMGSPLDGDDGEPIVLPSSPAGSLVEGVLDCLPYRDAHQACAVIRVVAAWLRSEYPRREGYGTAWANLIEQQANR